jgi:hypothetical protein
MTNGARHSRESDQGNIERDSAVGETPAAYRRLMAGKNPTQQLDSSGITTLRTRILQRKCACGRTRQAGVNARSATRSRRRCDARQLGRPPLPRLRPSCMRFCARPANRLTQPRAFLEPRFGPDFSRVRHARMRGQQSRIGPFDRCLWRPHLREGRKFGKGMARAIGKGLKP